MCSLSFVLAFSIFTTFSSFADGVLQDPDYLAEDAAISVVVKMHPELCGNGKKDPGEECDCGPPEKCRHDPCCHSTCQLKLYSQCSNNEPCCEKCKFKSLGTICKAAKHSCDIAQFCSGDSGACPSGPYKRNGVNCTTEDGGSGNGVCFNGNCKPFQQFCHDSWKNMETEPIKEKSKCLGSSICVNQTCLKVKDLPNAKPCPFDSQGRECSANGDCTISHHCRCHPGWTGSDCSEKQDVSSFRKNDDKPGIMKGVGPEQRDSKSNTLALVGGLVSFVIAVSVIFVVMAFRFIPSRTPKDNTNTVNSMYAHAQLETVDSDGPNAQQHLNAATIVPPTATSFPTQQHCQHQQLAVT